MTPLPVAFPDDPQVYDRENERVRGYEWLIGDALLATPLYGNDYASAMTRDVYLPRGKWMDYDTGKAYEGPTVLRNFELPFGKTPLFVGGRGIVEEKRGNEVVARVYPISPHAEAFFIDRDGVTRTWVRLNVADWNNLSVVAGDGTHCEGSWQRHAFEFVVLPGQSYDVR
jgi:alpha-glucosidase (family GH31 glycosyl hydrolase)